MSKLSLMVVPLVLLGSVSLVGCDTTDELHRPKTDNRAMIIGGVPVYEQDYKIPKEDVALNEAAASDD
ncbi:MULTISPECIES: NF038215 family lipoprotein [unclassified Acinetobacter]|uniref:NF038215 family lipoprotein n=1 Tax=unclassified Acinetobacter TaxID=196816 RepID=UPI0015D25543|nr:MULTISPECIES: NF038215 family lipoprotein [unclassified Acinetobacter]